MTIPVQVQAEISRLGFELVDDMGLRVPATIHMLPGKGGIVSIVIVQKRVLRCDCCLSEIDDAVVTKVYNGVRSDMCSDCQAQGYVLSDDLRFSRRLPGDVVQSEQSASAEVDA